MIFINYFSKIKDPRRKQGLRVDLEQILIMSVVSYLAGYSGYRGLSRFSKENADYFIPALALRHGVPSHVTFREVLMNIKQEELIESFKNWCRDFVPLKNLDWLGVDGKTLCSTVVNSQSKYQDFESVVTLFASESGLAYSLEHYRKKSKEKGEAPLARKIMSELQDMGLIFTMDALNTQKKQLKPS